jgi:hypothetical protein
MSLSDDLDALDVALSSLADYMARDEGFAQELYAALCNMRWQRDGMDAPVSMSWRSAGGVVADLVGRGGDYLDFYCSGNEGKVSLRVRGLLGEQGWTPVPWAGGP